MYCHEMNADERGHHGPEFHGFRPEGRPCHGPEFPGRGPENRCHGRGPGMPMRDHMMMPALPQDDSLFSLLFFASHAVRPRPQEGGPGMGGMAQHRVLKLLNETESISQQSLMEILAIRPGSLSELLNKLEAKGLITRTPDEADKRKNSLALTDAGREALKTSEDLRDPFSVLSEEEQETLKALLKKLIAARQ